jgi:hypothetical protein
MVLVGASVVLYPVLPRLDDTIEKSMSGGRKLSGRQFRVVGGPVLVAVLGALCIAAGIAKLVSGD